jgi:hypothetical protein
MWQLLAFAVLLVLCVLSIAQVRKRPVTRKRCSVVTPPLVLIINGFASWWKHHHCPGATEQSALHMSASQVLDTIAARFGICLLDISYQIAQQTCCSAADI